MKSRAFGWAASIGLLGSLLIAPSSPAAASSIGISVSCYSNPERTTIHNYGSKAVTVSAVGSTYKPYSDEPFAVYKRLKPGHSITYQTGYDAHSNVLTRRYIYNNDAQDGTRVRTSAGTYTKYC